jgi:ABC-type branched-subunit amino acid transport system substrate-binding protein
VSTREGLQQALVQGEPFPGVTGRFMFDEDGECRGETILVTVEGDEFRLVQQQTPSTP